MIQNIAGASARNPKVRQNIQVTELNNGLYRIDVNIEVPSEAETTNATMSLWVNPREGYSVTCVEETINGEKHFNGKYRYVERNGAWVLVGLETNDYNRKTGKIEARTILEVNEESLKVNQPIEDDIFTVKSLGIRKGARVVDEIKGEEYVFDDIPMHLKVAVAEAQKDLESLPDALMVPTKMPDISQPKKTSNAILKSNKIDAPVGKNVTSALDTPQMTMILPIVLVVICVSGAMITIVFRRWKKKRGNNVKS